MSTVLPMTLTVIVPVYDGRTAFPACFNRLLTAVPPAFELLGACPTLTLLLRRTIYGHLRRSRREKILNVFQRIRLRFFRTCGLASRRTSFASSRTTVSHRLLVVADGDRDTPGRCAEHSRPPWFHIPLPGSPERARNFGASKGIRNILLLIEADVRVPPSIMRQVADLFQREPGPAAVTGSLIFEGGARWWLWLLAPASYLFRKIFQGTPLAPFPDNQASADIPSEPRP